MKLDINELVIDEEDRNIFLIDDIILKADALRHSVLPRLENLLYLIISKIKEVYQVDLLDDSKVSKSPNFRKSNRNEPIKHDYQACSVWLSGKIIPDKWKSILRKNGEVSQHLPFVFQIQLTAENIWCYLSVNPSLKLTRVSYQIFDSWVEKNFSKIYPLLQASGTSYELMNFCNPNPLCSLNEYFNWKRNTTIVESGFSPETINYPLNEEKFESIKRTFLYLFPILPIFY